MFRNSKTFLICAVVLVTGCAASAFILTRASTRAPVPTTQSREQRPARNLALRPEAMKMSRRLGKRFDPSTHTSSVLGGILFVGERQNTLTITRNQTDTGEAVEIAFAAEPVVLKWNETDGPKTSLNGLTESQRVLIERLVFDSADYFVLAQLRGASYYTVARNVRPEEVGDSDNYNGPLWDIVRVDDSEKNLQKKPINSWRLFYINSQTGLIEKIVSEAKGERIETLFSDWTIVSGERVPSHVTWKMGSQRLMEFSLTTFSFGIH